MGDVHHFGQDGCPLHKTVPARARRHLRIEFDQDCLEIFAGGRGELCLLAQTRDVAPGNTCGHGTVGAATLQDRLNRRLVVVAETVGGDTQLVGDLPVGFALLQAAVGVAEARLQAAQSFAQLPLHLRCGPQRAGGHVEPPPVWVVAATLPRGSDTCRILARCHVSSGSRKVRRLRNHAVARGRAWDQGAKGTKSRRPGPWRRSTRGF